MKHALEAWEEIEPLLKDCCLLLFLDYDGTLTPIVEEPRLAQLSPRGKKILEDLIFIRNVKVILMSGRLLEELKERVGVFGIIYAGNHGFELEGPSIRHVHPGALDACKLMHAIFQQLMERFRHFPGIFVEDKVLTLSVHYRGVEEEKIAMAKQYFSEIVQPYAHSSQVILTEGKKVLEIRPGGGIQWDKGKALLWILGQVLAHSAQRVFPIYIGDDQTDEDAFRAVKPRGLGVKVLESAGGSLSEAAYYLHSPEEVLDFLERLKGVRIKNRGFQRQ